MKTLKDIALGETCIVEHINATPALKRKFLDLGITKGVEIQVYMQAPFADPIAIKVRGYELALRKSEASCIIVV